MANLPAGQNVGREDDGPIMFLVEIDAEMATAGTGGDFLELDEIPLSRSFPEQYQLAIPDFQAERRIFLRVR